MMAEIAYLRQENQDLRHMLLSCIPKSNSTSSPANKTSENETDLLEKHFNPLISVNATTTSDSVNHTSASMQVLLMQIRQHVEQTICLDAIQAVHDAAAVHWSKISFTFYCLALTHLAVGSLLCLYLLTKGGRHERRERRGR